MSFSLPAASCSLAPHTRSSAAPWPLTPSRHPSASSARQQQAYTSVDNSNTYRVFRPPLLDISNLLAGQAPFPQQIAAVKRECAATGFLAITGHGISSQQLAALFAAARTLFDLPLETKLQQSVAGMMAGRGYEISPEHKAYLQVCLCDTHTRTRTRTHSTLHTSAVAAAC